MLYCLFEGNNSLFSGVTLHIWGTQLLHWQLRFPRITKKTPPPSLHHTTGTVGGWSKAGFDVDIRRHEGEGSIVTSVISEMCLPPFLSEGGKSHNVGLILSIRTLTDCLSCWYFCCRKFGCWGPFWGEPGYRKSPYLHFSLLHNTSFF